MEGNSTPMMHLWTMANLRLLCITAPLAVEIVLYAFKSKDLYSSAVVSLTVSAFCAWGNSHGSGGQETPLFGKKGVQGYTHHGRLANH